MSKRVSMTVTEDEEKELLSWFGSPLPLATCCKLFLLSAARSQTPEKVTPSNAELLRVTASYRESLPLGDTRARGTPSEGSIKNISFSFDPSAPSNEALLELWLQNEPFSLLKDPQSKAALWAQSYPKVDLLAESRKIIAWWASNPSKRKTQRGVPRFVNAWLSRAASGGDAPRTEKPQPKSFAKIREDERADVWRERKKPGAYKTSR